MNSNHPYSPSDFFYALKENLLRLVLIMILGAGVGVLYAYITPTNYTSRVTFVVEEGKSSGGGLGNLASLAGQIGLDIGGLNSGSGVLSGDNVSFFFKSLPLIKQVLYTHYDSTQRLTMADRFSDIYGLKEKWEKNNKIGFKVRFFEKEVNIKKQLTKDSLLNELAIKIQKEILIIDKIDKKATILELKVTVKNDPMFAKIFCERILNFGVSKYVDIKTQKQTAIVEKLQSRSDNILALLNSKSFSGAQLQVESATMDLNPLYKRNTAVETEKISRDKSVLMAVFGEITKNLELAKFSLSQDTPVIQIIELPIWPLKAERISLLLQIFLFSTLFGLIFCSIIFIKIYNKSAIK